jgi:hypothetical protein
MNGRQKLVLAIGLALIVTTGLFPPWIQSWAFPASGEELQFRIGPGAEGYSWIFQPPGVPPWVHAKIRALNPADLAAAAEEKEMSEKSVRLLRWSVATPGAWRSEIDIARLLVEWGMIAAGVLAGVLLCGQRRLDVGFVEKK